MIESPKLNTKLLRAYSSPPLIYDIRGFFILTFAYRSTLWLQINFFGNNIGKRHLDIAVGTGTLLFLILKMREFRKKVEGEIIAIDYVPIMLDAGKKFFKNNPHVKLEVGDATQLNYDDDCFDTVSIANSLHCISDVTAALKETYRVLKPGGTFAANVLLFPSGAWPFKQIAQKIDTWGIKKGILHTPYYKEDIRNRITNVGYKILFEQVSGNSYNILAQKPLL